MSNGYRVAGRIVTAIGYVMVALTVPLLAFDVIALVTGGTHPLSLVGGGALMALFGLWGLRNVRNGRAITVSHTHEA